MSNASNFLHLKPLSNFCKTLDLKTASSLPCSFSSPIRAIEKNEASPLVYLPKKLILCNAPKETGRCSHLSPVHLPKIILHFCVHCPQIELQSQKWTRELYHVPFSTYKYKVRNSQGSRCEVSWFQLIWFRSSQTKVPQIMKFYKVAPEEP